MPVESKSAEREQSARQDRRDDAELAFFGQAWELRARIVRRKALFTWHCIWFVVVVVMVLRCPKTP